MMKNLYYIADADLSAYACIASMAAEIELLNFLRKKHAPPESGSSIPELMMLLGKYEIPFEIVEFDDVDTHPTMMKDGSAYFLLTKKKVTERYTVFYPNSGIKLLKRSDINLAHPRGLRNGLK